MHSSPTVEKNVYISSDVMILLHSVFKNFQNFSLESRQEYMHLYYAILVASLCKDTAAYCPS